MTATVRDVRTNPRELVIQELDAAQLPHALPDVDAAVMNTNYALQAHLSPQRDGLLVEVRAFILRRFEGSIVPVSQGGAARPVDGNPP